MKTIILKGRRIASGTAEGEALVSKQAISFCGGVDPHTGIITERGHVLMNENIKGKILVFPMGKGSSAFSHAAHACRVAGTQPKAIIISKIDAVVAQGTVAMHIPGVADLDQDPIEAISTGDYVKVDGDRGIVELLKM